MEVEEVCPLFRGSAVLLLTEPGVGYRLADPGG